MLTILSEMAKHRDEVTGEFRFDDCKIVYVAPMKALVQEMVGNFTKRLQPYGVVVNELTGDRQLTKAQIAETQIIVTTPEKWDVITRKSTDTSYTVRPDLSADSSRGTDSLINGRTSSGLSSSTRSTSCTTTAGP